MTIKGLTPAAYDALAREVAAELQKELALEAARKAIRERADVPKPHPKQAAFVQSTKKRIVCRVGRRGGKTFGFAIKAALAFQAGKRVLYAAPTAEQIERFWTTVCRIFEKLTQDGTLYKNETDHVIELKGTEQRIRAKTAWNADTLRGDYADLLILDEFQLMNEDAWGIVGAPMMIDHNGDAIFGYTPPSLHSRSASKATDPQHAAKLFKKAQKDKTGVWQTFTYGSHDNPHVSSEALAIISSDMTSTSYQMEIEANDIDEAPGALWKRKDIDAGRVLEAPALARVVIGVDPSASSTGDEAGIIGAGKGFDGHAYVLADNSLQGSPKTWASQAVMLYYALQADAIIAEKNNGGEMVADTIHGVDADVPVILVWASRGKQTRAEPVAAKYEPKPNSPIQAHHVGEFPQLEGEMTLWQPGDASPNRMDAAVWALTALLIGSHDKLYAIASPKQVVREITISVLDWFDTTDPLPGLLPDGRS